MKGRKVIMTVGIDTAVQDLMRWILENEYEVVEVVQCAGVADALATIESPLPDLIILDAALPSMDRVQFRQHLKDQQRTADVPVVE